MNAQFNVTQCFRIVSSGQPGADQAALDWALAHHINYGGWRKKSPKANSGVSDVKFQLAEVPNAGYLQKVEWNVRDSDGTIVFSLADKLDGSLKRNADFAMRHEKPFMHFRPGVHPKFIARFIQYHKISALNIVGKSESSSPGIYQFVMDALNQALIV